jgi:hypothetical protein
MLAKHVELVSVDSSLIRALKPFAEFDIENPEAQPARSLAILRPNCESQPVPPYFSVDVRFGGVARSRERD